MPGLSEDGESDGGTVLLGMLLPATLVRFKKIGRTIFQERGDQTALTNQQHTRQEYSSPLVPSTPSPQ